MRRRWFGAALLGASLCGTLSGCGQNETLLSASTAMALDIETPDTLSAVLPMETVGHVTGGSALVLATVGDRKLAFVGDRDGRAVRVVDAASHTPVADVPVAGKPWQLAVGQGRLYAALRDTNEVVTITAHEDGSFGVLSRTQLDSTDPVGLAATPDGSKLLVTTGWGQRLTALSLPSMETAHSIPLEREPRGVAVAPNGESAFITHAIGGQLTRIDLQGGQMKPPVQLAFHGADATPPPRVFFGCFGGLDPLMGDGRHPSEMFDGGPREHCAFKSAAAFSPRIVHERLPARVHKPVGAVPRDGAQGFALVITEREVIAPGVLVHTRPGGSEGGGVYGGGGGVHGAFPGNEPALVGAPLEAPLEAGDQSVNNQVRIRVMNHSFLAGVARNGFSGGHRNDGCFLPRAAAHDPVTETVLVGCLGTDEVVVHAELDEPLSLTGKRRWKVGSGPVGIAVDHEARQALVWSQYDRALSTLDLKELGDGPAEKNARVAYPKAQHPAAKTTVLPEVAGDETNAPLSPLARRGRQLFHATDDPRISRDGRACASCHPDGRDDGLTWPTPKGPRQTPMLAGKLDDMTAPFGWQGSAPTVPEHLAQTFGRLGGSGLEGPELEALLAYLNEMGTPKPVAQPDEKLVARGKVLFHDASVGCGSCHSQGGGSDGLQHGIEGSPMLETPSLKFVAGTGPWWHDGRYATLKELLVDTKGKMGWGHELAETDLGAIEAYLLTL